MQPGTSSRTCLLCHAVPHRAIRTPANNAHRLRHTLTSPYYTSFSWTRRETSRRPPRSRRSMSSRMPFSITSTATSSPSGSPLFQINAIKIQFSRDHDFAVKIYSFLRLLSFLSFRPQSFQRPTKREAHGISNRKTHNTNLTPTGNNHMNIGGGPGSGVDLPSRRRVKWPRKSHGGVKWRTSLIARRRILGSALEGHTVDRGSMGRSVGGG